MLNHTTYIIVKADPLKYMIKKTYQNMRTSKWIIHLIEFYLQFISQKLIKGQVIINHMVEHLCKIINLLLLNYLISMYFS